MKWFLPETPDIFGLLHTQLGVTIEGMDAFAEWAAGRAEAERAVRDSEHRADRAKLDLYRTLRGAFVTPLEPEDIFALSRGIDRIINQAKDTVRESEVMACPPDAPLLEMARLLAEAVRALDTAVTGLDGDSGTTTGAEASVKACRHVERVYRQAMADLLLLDDVREITARRELYRRGARIAEAIVDVAERVLYAVVKEA